MKGCDSTKESPTGELVVRTLAMPADVNPDGNIFGGWVLSQMDIAGGIITKRLVQGRTVTVAIESMSFHLPVLIGDVLCCYCQIARSGRTSIGVNIEAWVVRAYSTERLKVTEGLFTYVNIGKDGRPLPIPSP